MSVNDWNQLHDHHYRKLDIYEMLWDDVDLSQHRVTMANYGGPIAIIKEPRAPRRPNEAIALRIYSGSGRLLATVDWSNSRSLVSFHWSSIEQLVCVLEDGEVLTYSMQGEPVSAFTIHSSCKIDGIAECHQWSNGFVARTATSNKFWAVSSLTEPRPFELADAHLSAPPAAMTVMGGGRRGADLEVIIAPMDGSLVIIDKSNAQDLLVPTGPFNKLSVSSSGTLLACFNDEGTLHVFTTDLSSNVCKFATNSRVAPSAMVWCGDDAVLLHWPGMLLLVGMYGDFVKYSYESSCVLVPETDCVRILSNNSHEIITRVQDSIENVFKKDSTHPAAKLFDASEAYEARHAQAAELIRAIQAEDKQLDPTGASHAQLKSAIDACLAAASHEFAPASQQALLKAASYGKLFCPGYPADKFVDTCRVLRLLNAVRHPSIGIALTFSEYSGSDAEALVQRLTSRFEYLLAIRVCEAFKLESERVIVHWACTKIAHADSDDSSSRLSDEKLGEILIHQLQQCKSISYAPIASTAHRYGRRQLAIMLLEYEPLASDQVPLLLSMKEDALALDKAIASGDTDLVYMCLMHVHKHRTPNQVFALVRTRELARSLYVSYCRQTDLPTLKNLYFYLQLGSEAASVALIQAYETKEFKERLKLLSLAQEFFEKDKNQAFAAKATEEQIKLLQFERDQELNAPASDPSKSLVDMPLSAFLAQQLRTAVTDKDKKRVSKIASQFKVSDARMMHLQVKVLSEDAQWDDLYKLVQDAGKKGPIIGLTPFIEACIDQQETDEARKYIDRLTDHRDQIEWLCNIGDRKQAADLAARKHDMEALRVIKASTKDRQVLQHIEQLMQSMPH